MQKTTLVVMAAGLGSRYIGGIKQMEPVGPSGEIIMDYSVYDAIQAGFNKVVFIIRKDIEEDFKELFGKRIEKYVEVKYVIQDINDLPQGYSRPDGRTKPWGTGHAILSCVGCIEEPFAVINADDYYGKQAFFKMHDYLANLQKGQKYDYCMMGFILKNTLSDNGSVTRGLCATDEANKLTALYETYNVHQVGDNAVGDNVNGKGIPIALDSVVSMNMWGFTPEVLDLMTEDFPKFLDKLSEDDLKSEYLLPNIVGDFIEQKKVTVEVLTSPDSWFGVTYKEDLPIVIQSFHKLVEQGMYPEKLF